MRVLLTGSSGFLGQYVLNELINQGIDVVVVGRTHPIGYTGKFIEADLLKIVSYDELIKRSEASHLLHLAWYAEHGLYMHSRLNLLWLEASIKLIEAFCKAGGEKVVAAGTCAEYDWSYNFCREDITPLNPQGLYGTTKDATRRLVEVICGTYKTSFAWGRIFLPYGRGEDSRRLIPSLFAVFHGKLTPFGVNASAYKDFLHAEDVALGFLRLLQSDAEGSYNISSGQPIQIADMVRMIAAKVGGDCRIVLELTTDRPGEPDFLIGDSRKLKALGWLPKHSISSIVSYIEE